MREIKAVLNACIKQLTRIIGYNWYMKKYMIADMVKYIEDPEMDAEETS